MPLRWNIDKDGVPVDELWVLRMNRQKGDYGDFAEFEKEKVQAWLKKAEDFINTLDNIIERFTGESK